jgi:REP element-mobilizing transposase RayT
MIFSRNLRAGSVSDGKASVANASGSYDNDILERAGSVSDGQRSGSISDGGSNMSDPLAYFITFTTYGTWLHGRDSGSVDRKHNFPHTPFLPADAELEAARKRSMRQQPYSLDEPRRLVVLQTILEVARHRDWKLWAVHVRTNHVHVIVTAREKPEKIMSDLKAWASRRLRETFGESADRDRWTQHGSTRYLNAESAVAEAIVYVIDEQGERMAYYDGRPNEPEA